MAGYGGQPEKLEDQLRRMMLSSSPATPNPSNIFPPQQTHLVTQSQPFGIAGPTDQLEHPMQQQPPRPVVNLPNPRDHYGQVADHGRAAAGSSPYYDPPQAAGRGNPAHVPSPHYRGPPHTQQRSQNASPPFDPDTFSRRSVPRYTQQPPFQQRQLFTANSYGQTARPPVPLQLSVQYLQEIADREVPNVGMTQEERSEKDLFRGKLESICHELCAADPNRLPRVSLHCFGSLMSGFASQGSDMDLVIVVDGVDATDAQFSLLGDDLPRALEKRLLRLGYGARLLTRTRVPIIKICEKPGGSFLDKLRAERERWDLLSNEDKYPHLHRDDGEQAEDEEIDQPQVVSVDQTPPNIPAEAGAQEEGTSNDAPPEQAEVVPPSPKRQAKPRTTWTRERKAGPLDFPKGDVGILCDINFFNPLGIHNSQLLRCYSLCDSRVRPMVLFVKAWAKRRKINSSYSGTLPSYGYVLMVLHYLMNVARPPVIPNLQGPWRPSFNSTLPGATAVKVEDRDVDFWRNEEEIVAAAKEGLLTSNREPLGYLLAGFFRYFASQSGYPSFNWMRDVLALKKPGGIWSKQEKGWTGARTEQTEGKEVRHRYLFCIEDPFELSHNVARTVTHHGIVAIRDEFRRANRILVDVGHCRAPQDGQLLEPFIDPTVEEMRPDTANMPETWSGTSTPAADPQQQPAATPPRLSQMDSPVNAPRGPTQGRQPSLAPRQQQSHPTNQMPPHVGSTMGAPRGPAHGQQAPMAFPHQHGQHPYQSHAQAGASMGAPRGLGPGRFTPRSRGSQHNFRGQQRGAMHQQLRPQPQSFNSSDEKAFPALGAPKPAKGPN